MKKGEAVPKELGQSFEELYRLYYPQVVRHLTFLLGQQAAAEEVAQETFLTLYTEPPPRADNMRGWLFQVGSRLGLNALRSEKRRRLRETKSHLAKTGEVIPLEDAVLRQESVRQVRQVLEAMNPRDRVALLLRHSGFSYREISAATGIAPGSVGTILSRAQKSFLTLYRQVKGGDNAHVL